jgi:hypothetical protein
VETPGIGWRTTRANCTESREARTMAAVTLRVRVMGSSFKIDNTEKIALQSVNHCRTRCPPSPEKALKDG